MPTRETYTYAIVDVTARVYDEVRNKLAEAGYQYQIHADSEGEMVDMHGLALRVAPASMASRERRYTTRYSAAGLEIAASAPSTMAIESAAQHALAVFADALGVGRIERPGGEIKPAHELGERRLPAHTAAEEKLRKAALALYAQVPNEVASDLAAAVDAVILESREDRARCMRSDVQLAGILAAAEGDRTPDRTAKEGDYGWSVAYDAVVKLGAACDGLRSSMMPPP